MGRQVNHIVLLLKQKNGRIDMRKYEKVKLKDYIEQIRGVSYKPDDVSDENASGYLPILRANNIQENDIYLDDFVYVKESKIRDDQIIKKGDIIVCTSSGSKDLVGKAAQAKQDLKMSFGAFCKGIRPKNIFPEYLGNYFKSPIYRKTISKLSAGANINNIKNEHFDNLEIPLPAMEEQKKIAARLDAVSDLLAKQKQLLAEQDTLIQSLFYDMFGDLKCEESTIGNECILKSGTTFSKDNELDKGEYIYAKVADMNLQGNEVYIKTSRKYLSKKHVGNLFLNKGSIIFPKRGGAIRTNKKRILIEDSCVDLNIMGVFPGKKLTTQYLYVYFLNLNLESLCDGCVIPQINNKNITPLKIPVPPLELQEKFAAIVEQIETEKSKIKSAIAETQTLFNALMAEYFEE